MWKWIDQPTSPKAVSRGLEEGIGLGGLLSGVLGIFCTVTPESNTDVQKLNIGGELFTTDGHNGLFGEWTDG